MDQKNHINIIHLNEALKTQIVELKSQMEENELVYGIRSTAMSSLYIPKDPDFFMKEKNLELQCFLNMSNEKNSKFLIENIKFESESCEKFEYNEKSIPLLVNQYFINRMEKLAIMKHSLMLRWKRYCITKQLREHIETEYEERIKTIQNEYNDLKARIQRLKVVIEGYICNTDQGVEEISVDDMMIYLKGLTVHLYSMRYMSQVIRILQWVPTKFRKKKKDLTLAETHSASKSEKSTRYDLASESSYKSEFSKVTTAKPSEVVYTVIDKFEPFAAYGGGLAIDEKNLNMPLHTNNIIHFEHILRGLCHVYGITMDIKKIDTPAEEMELYSNVNRKFRTTFSIQEQMRTFKVYDKTDSSSDRWGVDCSQRALLKPSGWLKHNPFKPHISLHVSKYLNSLQSQKLVDEFLMTASMFVKKSNCEETQNNLRHHALVIQHLPVVHNTSVVSNPKGFNIADIFKLIYNKAQFTVKSFSADENKEDENPGEHDTYKFTETLQMLGLDDCEETKDDPSSVQGAYLSYLSLRFLKTRDLQRTCISILNYFRSIERTLVINDIGFSKVESFKPKTLSSDQLECENLNQNLGNHQYLCDDMDQFKILEHDFIQFEGVSNHDDFYFHDEGRIHVKDQMNNWIVYDIAVKDFEELEENLILIGSYYITMDKDYRLASLFNRKRSQSETDRSASFISEYGHREVDRFGVLYDLWNQHTEFLQCTMNLVDMYMEVYNSMYGKDERRQLAQIIINLIYRMPRLDTNQNYFIASYRLECQLLRAELRIMQYILEKEKSRQREYESTVGNENTDGYKLIEKLLIHVNTDESTLNPIYFLEFVPSMALITNVKKSLDYSISNYKENLESLPIYKDMKREIDFLALVEEEIYQNDVFSGNWYKPNLLNSLLSTSIMDSSAVMQKIGEQYVKHIEGKNTRGEKRTRKLKLVNEFGRLMELVSVRFRLIDSLWECQYLTSIYKNQALNLGYDSNHVYMRPQPFESAVRNDLVENYKPLLYVSSVQDDDTIVDKYTPEHECLAIHELDSVHVGRLYFSKELNVLNAVIGKGLEELQFTLKMQHCHQCSLAVAVLMCDICRPSVYTFVDQAIVTSVDRVDTVTGQSVSSYNLPINLQNGPIPLALDKARSKEMAKYDYYPEAFFSLQLEKTPFRDMMLNNFLKKNTNASKLTPIEFDKIKRENISNFITSFFDRITHIALKTQIIAYYNSITNILKLLPDIALLFFQFGNDTKPDTMSTENLSNFDIDPHILRNRSRKVISGDGKLLNIWYIPHFTEILFLHRQLDDATANKILTDLCQLVMAFHDIIHYIIGLWSLSFDNIKVREKIKSDVTQAHGIPQEFNCYNITHQYHLDPQCATDVFTDYERTNSFQLKKEFMDLENQIGNLKDPNNMEEVIGFLNARRNYHYLYFDTFINSILPEVLLASNRKDIYDQLQYGINSTSIIIKNLSIPRYICQDLSIPHPLTISDPASKKICPWRSHLDNTGPFIFSFDTRISIAESIQLCFAAIADKDRPIIQDQLYSFNLLVEEILLENGTLIQPPDLPDMHYDRLLLSAKFQKSDKKDANARVASLNEEDLDEQSVTQSPQYVSITLNPTEAYQVLIKHLSETNKLNMLKHKFCCEKMRIKQVTEVDQYRIMSKLFRREILFPQLRILSEELSMPYLYYFGPTSDNDIIIYPKGVSLIFINQKLIETLMREIHKIDIYNIQWRVSIELNKVIKARNYDGRENENIQFSILKKTILQPNLSVAVTKKFELLYVDEEKEVKDVIEVPEIHEVKAVIEDQEVELGQEVNETKEGDEIKDVDEIVESEEIKGVEKIKKAEEMEMVQVVKEIKEVKIEEIKVTELEETIPETIYLTFNKKLLNDCIQFFGNSVQHIQRETYESYAMYFENILKHQQQLIHEKDKTIKNLREKLQGKEQSISVEKQFIMAEKAAVLIMEINLLRGRFQERTKLETKQAAKVKKDMSLEFKFVVRNLYCLTFELMTHMKIAVSRFGCEIFQHINDTRTDAFNEMNKVKEKSGAKITTDDELLSRNVAINNQLNKSRQANSHIFMITARMKSVLNWIFSYSMNVNNEQTELFDKQLNERKHSVLLVEQGSAQKIKLMKCEVKRLNETLITTRKDLADLRSTLSQEINQKSNKRKSEEINAIKVKEGINHKRIQINKMLEVIKETNAKLSTMQALYDSNMANKEIVAIKSHKTVEKLKKILVKERQLKQEAFMKVDDLISQVYEFEAAFAVASDDVKPRAIRESTIEELSKPMNPTTKPGHPTINFDYTPPDKIAQRLTYDSVVKQHRIPYTSCHFLPYRRDRVGLHKIRTKLRRELSNLVDDKDKMLALPKLTRSQSIMPKKT